MKKMIQSAAVLLLLATLNSQLATVHAQGTAFTYQGRLNNNGSPASGLYDVRFIVWDAPTNGNLVAGPLTNSATGVINGLFTLTLDFGSGVFTGLARWLELDVRTNGNGAFTTLLPLQPILPVPYAVMANSASNLLGTLPAAQLGAGTANISISGSAATAVNGVVTTGTYANPGWITSLSGSKISGNISGNAANITGTLPATQLSGTVPLAQLPGAVLTNNSSGVNLSGTFNGSGGLIIENRTSDPTNPTTGQFWLRTDLP